MVHMSLKLIDSAIENNVILYCLPPHTTHLLQLLDRSVYKPPKNHFSTITDFITLASVTHGATGEKCPCRIQKCPCKIL